MISKKTMPQRTTGLNIYGEKTFWIDMLIKPTSADCKIQTRLGGGGSEFYLPTLEEGIQ